MKLLSIPLICNTDRSVFFDTALRVLRSVTLTKRCVMPKYVHAQNSHTSARSSNTRMDLTMFTEVTSLFLQQNQPVFFYIFQQKTSYYIICLRHKCSTNLTFMWHHYQSIVNWALEIKTAPCNILRSWKGSLAFKKNHAECFPSNQIYPILVVWVSKCLHNPPPPFFCFLFFPYMPIHSFQSQHEYWVFSIIYLVTHDLQKCLLAFIWDFVNTCFTISAQTSVMSWGNIIRIKFVRVLLKHEINSTWYVILYGLCFIMF